VVCVLDPGVATLVVRGRAHSPTRSLSKDLAKRENRISAVAEGRLIALLSMHVSLGNAVTGVGVFCQPQGHALNSCFTSRQVIHFHTVESKLTAFTRNPNA
jgi:hypothetical protein